MIEFELLSMWGGWNQSTVPDDLVIEFRADNSSREFYASLRDICLIFGLAHHRMDQEAIVGTGSVIELLYNENDQVSIEVNLLQTKTSAQELEAELTSLLQAIFTEKDRIEGEGSREEKFEHINSWLSDYGVEFDVEELYQSE